jgi:hypothetical protein
VSHISLTAEQFALCTLARTWSAKHENDLDRLLSHLGPPARFKGGFLQSTEPRDKQELVGSLLIGDIKSEGRAQMVSADFENTGLSDIETDDTAIGYHAVHEMWSSSIHWKFVDLHWQKAE